MTATHAARPARNPAGQAGPGGRRGPGDETGPASPVMSRILRGRGAPSATDRVTGPSRRAATAVNATVRPARPTSDPVAGPRPSQGPRTALVSSVSGSGPAICRTTAPITCGGGPPAPSRKDGKNSSSPTAWADRAEGSSGAEQHAEAHEAHRAERQRGHDPPPVVQGRQAVDRRGHRQQQRARHRRGDQPDDELRDSERPAREARRRRTGAAPRARGRTPGAPAA